MRACPKRLADEIDGHKITIDEHGRRLRELEAKVTFLGWLYKYLGLWVGLMGLSTTVFLKLSEVSPFLNSANIFLLMIVSFLAGTVFGWLIKTSAKMIFQAASPNEEM